MSQLIFNTCSNSSNWLSSIVWSAVYSVETEGVRWQKPLAHLLSKFKRAVTRFVALNGPGEKGRGGRGVTNQSRSVSFSHTYQRVITTWTTNLVLILFILSVQLWGRLSYTSCLINHHWTEWSVFYRRTDESLEFAPQIERVTGDLYTLWFTTAWETESLWPWLPVNTYVWAVYWLTLTPSYFMSVDMGQWGSSCSRTAFLLLTSESWAVRVVSSTAIWLTSRLMLRLAVCQQ